MHQDYEYFYTPKFTCFDRSPTPREVYSIQRLQQQPYETGNNILPTV
jgi:hypothetical protein